MKKQIVSYKNDFNKLVLKDFTALDMDLFMTLCSKVKDKGTSEVIMTFEELYVLSKYKSKDKKRFVNDIEKLYDKLLSMSFKMENTKQVVKFVLFTRYIVNKEEEYVSVRLNTEFEFLLNELTQQFTKFELEEFTSLKRSYSKSIYRLLKQYRLTGFYRVDIETFRKLVMVPNSYRMSDITQKILNPSMKELKKYFKGLELKKIKGTGKNSRRIEFLEFSFVIEDDFKNGVKKFRDEEGNYYTKHIEDLNKTEINKAFPHSDFFDNL